MAYEKGHKTNNKDMKQTRAKTNCMKLNKGQHDLWTARNICFATDHSELGVLCSSPVLDRRFLYIQSQCIRSFAYCKTLVLSIFPTGRNYRL